MGRFAIRKPLLFSPLKANKQTKKPDKNLTGVPSDEIVRNIRHFFVLLAFYIISRFYMFRDSLFNKRRQRLLLLEIRDTSE